MGQTLSQAEGMARWVDLEEALGSPMVALRCTCQSYHNPGGNSLVLASIELVGQDGWL